MVRFKETPLSTTDARRVLTQVIHAGIAGASGARLVARAVAEADVRALLDRRPVTLISAGKVAVQMAAAFLQHWNGDLRGGVVASPLGEWPDERLDYFRVGHPVPTQSSVDAARRALEVAGSLSPDDTLLLLLSGGASAALAAPVDGVTLADKVLATEALLRGGVAIDGINCVRKHLSMIKGGWLAASTPGRAVTLAVSDVVGPVADDPAVIGSGPTAPDPTHFEEALRIADRRLVRPHFPSAATAALERGRRGTLAETPKAGDPRLANSSIKVIGGRLDAVRAAANKATALGFHVGVLDAPVVGEAREVAEAYIDRIVGMASSLSRPACIVSAGETTVTVTGTGRGGRNQEFGLALVGRVSDMEEDVILASVGTDGVDGPTDAAGAVVDRTTLRRAAAKGVGSPTSYLDRNDAYAFFHALGDLVMMGPTGTNVGDLQVVLLPEHRC